MTKKMKKLDKESNVWKTRFESTNKALSEMIEEVNYSSITHAIVLDFIQMHYNKLDSLFHRGL